MYFDLLTQAAESGLFEIIGHADLPKKFGIYPERDCTPLFERFLQAAARAQVAMELNTAGLRKDCREIYPAPRIVQLAKKHGVAITFGSDAHAPGEVGMNFPEAIALARAAGTRKPASLRAGEQRKWFGSDRAQDLRHGRKMPLLFPVLSNNHARTGVEVEADSVWASGPMPGRWRTAKAGGPAKIDPFFFSDPRFV